MRIFIRVDSGRIRRNNNGIEEGVKVPLYFQIGQWPSVEMAVDYLAWGFFMGLAFICLSLPIASADKTAKSMKVISLIDGILCLIGFVGALFINGNIWYLAPMGYCENRPCSMDKGMLTKIKPYGFTMYIKRYGEPNLLDSLFFNRIVNRR